jgi:hypothetical protein
MINKTFHAETITGWFSGTEETQTDHIQYLLIESNSTAFIKLGDYFYDSSDLQYMIQQLVTFQKQIDAGK